MVVFHVNYDYFTRTLSGYSRSSIQHKTMVALFYLEQVVLGHSRSILEQPSLRPSGWNGDAAALRWRCYCFEMALLLLWDGDVAALRGRCCCYEMALLLLMRRLRVKKIAVPRGRECYHYSASKMPLKELFGQTQQASRRKGSFSVFFGQ